MNENLSPEQYAESLIESYQSDWYADRAIKTAISDVQHTIEALTETKKEVLEQYGAGASYIIHTKIHYYQQALTYLQNKLK